MREERILRWYFHSLFSLLSGVLQSSAVQLCRTWCAVWQCCFSLLFSLDLCCCVHLLSLYRQSQINPSFNLSSSSTTHISMSSSKSKRIASLVQFQTRTLLFSSLTEKEKKEEKACAFCFLLHWHVLFIIWPWTKKVFSEQLICDFFIVLYYHRCLTAFRFTVLRWFYLCAVFLAVIEKDEEKGV